MENEISGKTRLAGLYALPARHSFSPIMLSQKDLAKVFKPFVILKCWESIYRCLTKWKLSNIWTSLVRPLD
jgi:hypothetical protein